MSNNALGIKIRSGVAIISATSFPFFYLSQANADQVTLSNPVPIIYTESGNNINSDVEILLDYTPTVKALSFSAPPAPCGPWCQEIYESKASIMYNYEFIINGDNDIDVSTTIESYLYAFIQTGFDFSYHAGAFGSVSLDGTILHSLGSNISVTSTEGITSFSYEESETYIDTMFLSPNIIHTISLYAYASTQNGFALAIADPYITVNDPDYTITFSPGINNIKNEQSPVPEPTTMLLFSAGLAGLAAVGRRRRD